MIDFKQQHDSIIEYVKEHLPGVLTSMNLSDVDAYIDDYIDLDKYTKSKQLFFDFTYYNYDYETNESNTEDSQFSVLFAFKNAKAGDLRNCMLNYTTAFYKMFEDSGCNLGGIADYGIIQTVNFYPCAEGNPDIKVAELVIHLITER